DWVPRSRSPRSEKSSTAAQPATPTHGPGGPRPAGDRLRCRGERHGTDAAGRAWYADPGGARRGGDGAGGPFPVGGPARGAPVGLGGVQPPRRIPGPVARPPRRTGLAGVRAAPVTAGHRAGRRNSSRQVASTAWQAARASPVSGARTVVTSSPRRTTTAYET